MVGEIRHVKSSTGYVKLYMNADALESDDPTRGFYNSNHYAQSCGPTAGLNLFDWYGADDASWRCVEDPPLGGRPATQSCSQMLTLESLATEMHMNTWFDDYPGASWLLQQLWGHVGTTSRDLGIGLQFHHRYLDSRGEFVYRVKGSADEGYDDLWNALSGGNPVVVALKTSAKGPEPRPRRRDRAVRIRRHSRRRYRLHLQYPSSRSRQVSHVMAKVPRALAARLRLGRRDGSI